MYKRIDKRLAFKSTTYPGFSCRKCGECCRSTPSITIFDVMKLSSMERKKLELLKNQEVSFPTVKKKELILITEKSRLIISPKTSKKFCAFYNKGECMIHERKPEECGLSPYSVYLEKKGNQFLAKPFMPNYCEALKYESERKPELDEQIINHLKNMIKHEYFIITLKKIPDDMEDLIKLWNEKKQEIESKTYTQMLNEINKQRKKEKSELIFKTCC